MTAGDEGFVGEIVVEIECKFAGGGVAVFGAAGESFEKQGFEFALDGFVDGARGLDIGVADSAEDFQGRAAQIVRGLLEEKAIEDRKSTRLNSSHLGISY